MSTRRSGAGSRRAGGWTGSTPPPDRSCAPGRSRSCAAPTCRPRWRSTSMSRSPSRSSKARSPGSSTPPWTPSPVTSAPPDEFDWIAALRPLTRGEPAALGLMDDAAVISSRPGFDLVVSEDAMVEGVHFLGGEDAAIVARRLLRTSLSDLAAKAAEPFGYTLMTAWPPTRGWSDQEAFIRGLAEDGEELGVTLLGGDIVSTPGPLTVSATVFGWVPSGRAVRRDGARPGDVLVVLGAIGDGYLGLKAAL